MKRRFGLALGLLCFAASVSAIGASETVASEIAERQISNEETMAGDPPEQVWAATCGYCHGRPGLAPELRGRGLPEPVIIAFVRNGAPGMPPFHESELSDAEVDALAQWIRQAPAPVQEGQ